MIRFFLVFLFLLFSLPAFAYKLTGTSYCKSTLSQCSSVASTFTSGLTSGLISYNGHFYDSSECLKTGVSYCVNLNVYSDTDTCPDISSGTGAFLAPGARCIQSHVSDPDPNLCSLRESASFESYQGSGGKDCFGGCASTAGSRIVFDDGSTYGTYTYTGLPCETESGDPMPADSPDSSVVDNNNPPIFDPKSFCEDGSLKATVNGVSKCFPIDKTNGYESPNLNEIKPENSSTTSETTNTVLSEDGTKTTTTTSTVTSSSGHSSTTITIVTQNPDGSSTTESSSEETAGSLNFTNFDTSGGSASFWTSSYPDGLSGVWANHESAFMQTPMMNWLNSWSMPNSGNIPTFCFSFDLGVVNFGQSCIPTDLLSSIVPYLRAIFLLSSLLLARRLIFGG